MSKNIYEKVQEAVENTRVNFWHNSNKYCRDWWDSIEDEDYISFAGIEIGCVGIEAMIMGKHNTNPKIAYMLIGKHSDKSWEHQDTIIQYCDYYNNRIETWDDIMNDMLFSLIQFCDNNEIDYEAKYYSTQHDIRLNLKNKLDAEFKAYLKYLKDKCVDVDEIISYHYIITMKNEFRNVIEELAKEMTPKEIRQKILEKDDILENLFQEFIKKDIGEIDIYKEFILNTIKEEM